MASYIVLLFNVTKGEPRLFDVGVKINQRFEVRPHSVMKLGRRKGSESGFHNIKKKTSNSTCKTCVIYYNEKL